MNRKEIIENRKNFILTNTNIVDNVFFWKEGGKALNPEILKEVGIKVVDKQKEMYEDMKDNLTIEDLRD